VSVLGKTLISARSRSGRRWRVQVYNASTDEYTLAPVGADVRPAQDRHGKMQGGPRRIRRTTEQIERDWRVIT
jgi:hypothetical protein